MLDVRKRDHYGEAVCLEFEKVEAFHLQTERPNADVLNSPNTVVGVYDLFA
jgi:hypothetical protein